MLLVSHTPKDVVGVLIQYLAPHTKSSATNFVDLALDSIDVRTFNEAHVVLRFVSNDTAGFATQLTRRRSTPSLLKVTLKPSNAIFFNNSSRSALHAWRPT